MGPFQQRVLDAEVKLLQQQEQLWDAEQAISHLDTVIAELRKQDLALPRLPKRFEKPSKTRTMEEDLVKVANNMPRSEFLRVAPKVTKDAGGFGGSVDLCAPLQVDDTPVLILLC